MAASDVEKIDLEAARREIASSDAVPVDVRSEEDFREGHVPGAIHLPDGDSGSGTKEPERGSRLIVIADNGKHAVKAAGKLSEAGYEAVAVDGDMGDWISEDFNVQPTADPDEETELGLN